MDYVVYTDESRHDGVATGRYMGIGGLWVPRDEKPALTKMLQQLRRDVGLTGEIKWSKVSRVKLDAYKRLIEFFCARESMRFRIIIVDKTRLDHGSHNQGDAELGFYKFYYEMLVKWMEPPHRYLVLIDFKTNRGADRFGDLRRILVNGMARGASLVDLTINDSFQSPLAQLADLLTGCITSAWCGLSPDSPRDELARFLATKSGARIDEPSASPRCDRVNIFKIAL